MNQQTITITSIIISVMIMGIFSGCISNDDGLEIEEPISEDTDGDGVMNSQDAFPNDFHESSDTDGDGVGDNTDEDDDGDGYSDDTESTCQSDSLNPTSVPPDNDGDEICDQMDEDDDNDGVNDTADAFPFDSSETMDSDGDGIGDRSDPDFASLIKDHRNFRVSNLQPDLLNYTNDPEWFGINITTWQMDNGGWGKIGIQSYMAPWDGEEDRSSYSCLNSSCTLPSGRHLSTFDNNATTAEIRFLSMLFVNSESDENRSMFRQSVNNGIQFILDSQYDSGGWPQVYPERFSDGAYSNLVTFNDHTMVRVMLLLRDIVDGYGPFSSDITSKQNLTDLNESLNLGMDFILRSQIIVDGKRTIWCQQHHPETYQPMSGRPYELVGRTGWESAGVTALLLNWPERTAEIDNATWGAVQWYHDNVNIEKSYQYGISGDLGNGGIIDEEGGMMWFRYYNLSDSQHFMAGRDSVKVYDVADLTLEMKTTYEWGGNWGRGIIIETSKIGYSRIDMT